MKNSHLLLLIILLLSACSAVDNQNSSNHTEISNLKLYVSRSSLYTTEFEQYTLSDDILFQECGKMSNGRHQAGRQNVIKIDSDNMSEIKAALNDVISYQNKSLPELSKSGNNSDLFDPGIFNLELESTDNRIETSLDAVTSGSGPIERKLQKLARAIRKSSESGLCNKEFYGLGI